MTLNEFLAKVKEAPKEIVFDDTMQIIDGNYLFSPTAFQNGDLSNEAGQNSGSCKLFAFAKYQELTTEQTLHCFGTYYREDVLQDPNGSSHQNIRNFMKHGWEGIQFEKPALEKGQN